MIKNCINEQYMLCYITTSKWRPVEMPAVCYLNIVRVCFMLSREK